MGRELADALPRAAPSGKPMPPLRLCSPPSRFLVEYLASMPMASLACVQHLASSHWKGVHSVDKRDLRCSPGFSSSPAGCGCAQVACAVASEQSAQVCTRLFTLACITEGPRASSLDSLDGP